MKDFTLLDFGLSGSPKTKIMRGGLSQELCEF